MFIAFIGAQSITNVRSGLNLRFTGNVLIDSAGDSWLLWEENTEGTYHVMCQKFNISGEALFPSPIQINLADTSVKLLNAIAASDAGLLVLFSREAENEQADVMVQKINPMGQALWANGGYLVAGDIDVKQQQVSLCANNQGGAFVIAEADYTTEGTIFRAMNLNAEGSNIWTAAEELTYPDYYSVNQLMLTGSGNLIYSLKGYQTQGFYLVDSFGNPVGNNPIFDPGAPIPANARMVKAANSNIMLYSEQSPTAPNLSLQMLDADLEPVFSNTKVIPLATSISTICARNLTDGGFLLSYHYQDSPDTEHIIKTHRLDANLDELWSAGSAEIPVSGENLGMLHTAADPTGSLWLTAFVADSYYNDGRVLLANLDENGNTQFYHQSVSSDSQLKYYPKLVVSADQATLFWKEHTGENNEMKRQIFDSLGNELLPENGEVLSSLLAGSAEVFDTFTLGNRSICFYSDNRYLVDKYYYQIFDEHMNPCLPLNGKELISPTGTLNLADLEVISNNTIAIAYTAPDSIGNRALYYQEIDDNGVQLYPDGGILLADNVSSNNAIFSFDGNNTYIYWNAYNNHPVYSRKIVAQKISNGNLLWESNGRILYYSHYMGSLYAMDRFVAFTTSDRATGIDQVRALRFTEEGEIEPGWEPDGILIFAANNELNNPYIQNLVMLDGHYYLFTMFDSEGKVIRAQKINQQGDLLWGESGLPIGNAALYHNHIAYIKVSDQITLLCQHELQSAFLHRIDSNGNLQFGETGLLMPGNGSMSNGAKLVEHDNGAYSFFWIDHLDPAHKVKHAPISGNGVIGETQVLAEGRIFNIFATVSADQATLYWHQYFFDNLDYDEGSIKSIFATSLPEPVSNQDNLVEAVPIFSLAQNSPNPFINTTSIGFSLQKEAPLDLEIFNVKGQLVRKISLNACEKGDHIIHWDGKDARGNQCSAGLYLYKLSSGKFSSSKKMILLK